MSYNVVADSMITKYSISFSMHSILCVYFMFFLISETIQSKCSWYLFSNKEINFSHLYCNLQQQGFSDFVVFFFETLV